MILQTEKSDHTVSKGHLQSPNLPVQELKEASIYFVTDLPDGKVIDSAMTVMDKVMWMTHLFASREVVVAGPCSS